MVHFTISVVVHPIVSNSFRNDVPQHNFVHYDDIMELRQEMEDYEDAVTKRWCNVDDLRPARRYDFALIVAS
jgi:hypothetical protein